MPFSLLILPPIDLRYGWHLGHKPHQQLLREFIFRTKPSFVSGEPRCKYWSRSGVRRDKAVTGQRRQEERPSIDFNTEVMHHQVQEGRHGIVENPRPSELWHQTSTQSLMASQHFAAYFTDQCCFSTGVPDGERSRKQTTLLASFELWHARKRCKCSKGHILLQGKCEDGKTNRTAKAALFPYRLCQAIAQDMMNSCDTTWFHSTTKQDDLTKQYNKQSHQAHNNTAYPATPLPPAQIHVHSNWQGDQNADDAAQSAQHNRHLDGPKPDISEISAFSPGFGPSSSEPAALDTVYVLPPGLEPARTSAIPLIPAAASLVLCGNMSLINPDLESHFNESLQHLFEDISDCYKNTAGSLLLVPSETMPDSARLLHGIHDVHEALAKGMKIECLQIHINYNDLPMTLDATVTEDYYCLLCVLEEDCKHVNLHLLSLKHVPQQQLQQRPVVLCAGRLTELGAISAGIFPAKTKTTPISSTPHRPLHPSSLRIVEDIRVSAEREPIKPSQDFKDFPRRLLHADRKERTRLLVGLHQRFYHCGVTDMIRLLNAMLLPRDVIQQGIEVCQQCSDCHCQRYANKAPRPQLRGYVAVQFNEYVLMDLFFLWSQPFILLIDHCTHWKTGCHLPNKQASSLLQALMSQWIRVWGPMHTLCSDQEGGLSSSEATVFCERLGITRTFVGTSAYHSKGLVERHVALTKHSMMILKSTSTKEGLHLSYDDLIHEVTISQNMLLEKGGVTPQTAVTGINPREFWQMDNEQLQAHTGALDVKADFAEQAIRGRLLAKQAILEAVVGERLAIARRTKQQKHDLSLLIAGMAIDIYRQPHRKDDFGWHGPAELVSVNRHSGTAIIVHQGQPLVLPLNHIRKHVALDYFIHYYTSDTHIMDYDPRGCNETYAADEIFHPARLQTTSTAG